MVRSMGVTSSQLQAPLVGETAIRSRVGEKDRIRKVQTSNKRNSEDMRGATDDYESARALMQLREAPIQVSRDLDDSLAASQQLIAESSPVHASKLSTSSQKVKNRKKHVRRHKKQRGDHSVFSSGEGYDEKDERAPHTPSTPAGRILRSSPPPYRPPISQPTHALDDISTDDEDITTYMQEYEREHETSHRPEVLEHDIYSFSQQPTDAADDQGYGTAAYSTYHLPKHVYASPKASAKQTKRKRRSTPIQYPTEEIEQLLQNEQGEDAPIFYFDNFDESFINERDSADWLGLYQDNDMLIDPELHSMSALQPSVDLSQLENGTAHVPQRKKKKAMPDTSAPPSKRRRTEESLDAPNPKVPNYTPYNVEHDEGNMQDTILPGLEDLQRQTSPELGEPYMADIAHRSLEFLSDGPSQGQTAKRKKNVSLLNENGNKTLKEAPVGKKSKSSQRAVSEKGGPYTATEAEKLDRFRDSYCEANNMSVEQFNNHIQSSMRGNPMATEIFNECHEILLYRPRMSVQKFCRRRFHNFQRGAWSAEEDEILKQAVAEKGNNFKAVSEMVGRKADDCRDRYRNYVHNSESRNREKWTNKEVQLFCNAIEECMQAMRDDRRQMRIEEYGEDAPDTDLEADQEEKDMKLINWQVVSDRMGGRRSRLQCIFKWSQIKTMEQKELLRKARDARGFEERKSTTKNPWRKKRALQKVANMKAGDQYALVQAILNSEAATEGNIPWISIGDDGFRSIWNSADKKAAWSKMKRQIEGSENMDYCDVANEIISRIVSSAPENLDVRWDPEVHGNVSAKARKHRQGKGKQREDEYEGPRREEKKAKRMRKESARKSELFVHESDEEEIADSTNESQNHNRYNALLRSDDAETASDATNDGVSTAEGDVEESAEGGAAEDEEADSLFDASNDGDEEPLAEDGVGEDLAKRVYSLKNAVA